MPQVSIVNMPFSNLRWPNLGPSLLSGALRDRGIDCKQHYFNFDFAERIGLDRYGWIADCFAFVLGGERLFAKHYFGAQLPDDESYYRHVLLVADSQMTPGEQADYEAIGQHVAPFLQWCLEAENWAQYAVVGFACSFQQTMASLCLAREIKRRWPHVKIVFGGAACEAEMGITLLNQFTEIDYVFLGEADHTLPAVVVQLLDGTRPELPAGVVGRENLHRFCGGRCLAPAPPGADSQGHDGEQPTAAGGSAQREQTPSGPSGKRGEEPLTIRAPEAGSFLVFELDRLPYPDFDDYFARLRASKLSEQIDPLLFVETSRGCWWGQKHHCKFCGLNGSTLTYRSKSPPRAVAELEYLVRRYGVHRACTADNILDFRYFDTFVPLLHQSGIDLSFVYEMKCNLKRSQIDKLVRSGLRAAQLGIETFSTTILKLIGKGATGIQNLQTLKWFSRYNMEVKWNYLYGFPGEPADEYRAMADLVPSLVHLAAPLAVGRVRLDRFSPYFENPAENGMTNVRPNRAFSYVYPFGPEVLQNLAYYFEYDYADRRNPLHYAQPLLDALAHWQQHAGCASLRQYDRPDGVLILTDTRPNAATLQHRFTGWQRAVYLYCDTGRTMRKIVEFLETQYGADRPDSATVASALRRWHQQRLVALLDDRYLSLALEAEDA